MHWRDPADTEDCLAGERRRHRQLHQPVGRLRQAGLRQKCIVTSVARELAPFRTKPIWASWCGATSSHWRRTTPSSKGRENIATDSRTACADSTKPEACALVL